jgi:glucosamine-6-phosphate deaminase
MTRITADTRDYGALRVEIHPDARAMGEAAAAAAADTLRAAIAAHGAARVVLATGNSQLPLFAALRRASGVDWKRVEAFHMDEYVGIDEDHPASFRRFLREHVIEPLGIGRFHGIDGAPERAQRTMAEYEAALRSGPIDLCCMGIGENGHLAFNDPPFARFDDDRSLRVVSLDEVSRRQQVGEGHFPTLAAVPERAITLTIPALLRAERVLVVVPEARKAAAVQRALEGPIETDCPASILRTAKHATLYLDRDSAGRLRPVANDD